VNVELLLDNSAWARLNLPSLPQRRAEEIADAIEQRRIGVCLPFLLEAGYSAHNAKDHSQLVDELSALPFLHLDEQVERRAIDAQRQLARAGHHRLPPVDVIIAAIADRHHGGVLHYDGDYDIIAKKTDLSFRSEWLAPSGAL
jgi:predicted nucleic acid-binding protein